MSKEDDANVLNMQEFHEENICDVQQPKSKRNLVLKTRRITQLFYFNSTFTSLCSPVNMESQSKWAFHISTVQLYFHLCYFYINF